MNQRPWWLPPYKEFLSFFAGLAILAHQTIYARAAQTILVVAAIACMGVLGNGVAQRALQKLLDSEVK